MNDKIKAAETGIITTPTPPILSCTAPQKKYFDTKGFTGKLPSINQLKAEYAALAAEKKKPWGES